MGKLALMALDQHRILNSIRDVYDIYYKQPGLNPTTHIQAAEYPSVQAYTLPDGRTATIEDICDFIVEYINSDVLVCYFFRRRSRFNDRHVFCRAFWQTDT